MPFPSNSEDKIWSRDRDAFLDLLKYLNVDEVLTFERAIESIGRSREWLREVFFDCKRRLARDHSMCFDSVRNVGWTRLSDVGAVDHGRRDLNKGRRHLVRSEERARTVDTSKLPREVAAQHSVYSAQLSTLRAMAAPQKRATVIRKVSNGEIDTGNVSDVFREFSTYK